MWTSMSDYFSELDKIFDRRTDENKENAEAAELTKLQKIRFIIEDKTTASNYKVEQIKGVLNEER